MSEEEQYEVNKIVNHRKNQTNKIAEVRVNWVGFDSKDDTWEDIKDLLVGAGVDVRQIVGDYFKKISVHLIHKKDGNYDFRRQTPQKTNQNSPSPSNLKKKGGNGSAKKQPVYQSNISNSLTLTDTQSEKTAEVSPRTQRGYVQIQQIPASKPVEIKKSPVQKNLPVLKMQPEQKIAPVEQIQSKTVDMLGNKAATNLNKRQQKQKGKMSETTQRILNNTSIQQMGSGLKQSTSAPPQKQRISPLNQLPQDLLNQQSLQNTSKQSSIQAAAGSFQQLSDIHKLLGGQPPKQSISNLSNQSDPTACFGNLNQSSKRPTQTEESQSAIISSLDYAINKNQIKIKSTGAYQNQTQKLPDPRKNRVIQDSRPTSSEPSLLVVENFYKDNSKLKEFQKAPEPQPKAAVIKQPSASQQKQQTSQKPPINQNLTFGQKQQPTKKLPNTSLPAPQSEWDMTSKMKFTPKVPGKIPSIVPPITPPIVPAKSLNINDQHMTETIELQQAKLENVKRKIVWKEETNINVVTQKTQKDPQQTTSEKRVQQQINEAKIKQSVAKIDNLIDTKKKIQLDNVRSQGDQNKALIMEVENALNNNQNFDNTIVEFEEQFTIKKTVERGPPVDCGTQMENFKKSVHTLTDQETNKRNIEVQCQLNIDSQVDNEVIPETSIEETDPDWIDFNKIMNDEIPEGWTVVEGVLWNTDHKPKKILCQALHVDPEKIDDSDANWGQPKKKQTPEDQGVMYCLVAFKKIPAEKKIISPTWIPRCMILGNYPDIYFEYTDKLLREQNNHILNYQSKEEKKMIKQRDEEEKENPTIWKDGDRVNFNLLQVKVKDTILIELVSKEITLENVSAIVNGTTSDLGLSSQLSVIQQKGGYIVKHECEEYRRKNGKLAQGTCALTMAGKLPCKYIIHAAPPQWQYEENINILCLKDFILEIMKTASKNPNITSISLPAIAIGMFTQSRGVYCKAMIQTVIEWAQQNFSSTKIRNIRLCNIDGVTCHFLKQQFVELLK